MDQTPSTEASAMIPQKYAHVVFGFVVTFMMTCLVSAISTFLAIGFTDRFPGVWLGAWMSSWAVAFPAVLVVTPLTNRIVALLTRG
jgi:hypothetical protein